MSQTDRTDALTPDMFSAVARNVFGSTTQVSSVEKLKHGVDNQPYKITLHGHDRIYVFRFRRWRQDNYQHEIQNYERIHKLTGIDVPTVHCLDQSRFGGVSAVRFRPRPGLRFTFPASRCKKNKTPPWSRTSATDAARPLLPCCAP